MDTLLCTILNAIGAGYGPGCLGYLISKKGEKAYMTTCTLTIMKNMAMQGHPILNVITSSLEGLSVTLGDGTVTFLLMLSSGLVQMEKHRMERGNLTSWQMEVVYLEQKLVPKIWQKLQTRAHKVDYTKTDVVTLYTL